jgi:hypothetical protein
VNIVKILCIRVCKWKGISVETIARMWWGMKENDGEGEFKYGIFDIVRTFVNVIP